MRNRGRREGGGVIGYLFRLAVIAAVLFGGYVVIERAGGVNNVIDRVSAGIAGGVDTVDDRIMGREPPPEPPEELSDERKDYLKALDVQESTPGGYARAKFLSQGYGNADPSGDPCVILRQSALVKHGSGGDCGSPKGPWTDRFTGEKITDAEDVMVASVVPWEKLWAGGGDTATAERRAEMASDPDNIVLTSPDLDRQGRFIDQWVPPHDECGYADGYARVLSEYDLSITAAERAALLDIWGRC